MASEKIAVQSNSTAGGSPADWVATDSGIWQI
jgi:hypothetical protein